MDGEKSPAASESCKRLRYNDRIFLAPSGSLGMVEKRCSDCGRLTLGTTADAPNVCPSGLALEGWLQRLSGQHPTNHDRSVRHSGVRRGPSCASSPVLLHLLILTFVGGQKYSALVVRSWRTARICPAGFIPVEPIILSSEELEEMAGRDISVSQRGMSADCLAASEVGRCFFGRR